MNEEVMNKMVETMESLNTRMQNIEQERAAHNEANPARVETPTVSMRDIEDALMNKRAITLGGAGSVAVVKELMKEAMQKSKVASRCRFFYGPNASTNIPVLSPSVALPSKAAEGATNLTADSQATLSGKSITPYAWYSELAVSYETIKMGAADIKSALVTVFRDAFVAAMDTAAVAGTGANNMKGVFTNVPTANKIACGASGLPTLADMVALAEAVLDKDIVDPVIIISPTVHASLIAETGSVYDFIKEELVRDKSILGVEVIVTGKAPSSTTAGNLTAFAGSLQNYAIAVAADLTIEPIRKTGDTNTYFQAIMAFSGDTIIPADTFALKAV